MSQPVRAQSRSTGPQAGSDRAVPDRMFFKIGEVSRLTGLEAYVLRYWETEFPGLRPRKSGGGQRVYTRKDVETVLQIKRMLYEQGFTIAGARKRLRARSPAEQVERRALLGEIRGELQSILNDLKACTPLRAPGTPGAAREERGRS